jgi:8-amino-7-oxononanoate synthase
LSADQNPLFGLSAGDKSTLIERMRRRVRQEETIDGSPSASATPPASALSERTFEAFCRFDELPGFKQLQMMRMAADGLGIDSPFFRVHEGVAGATTVIDGNALLNFASYNYLGLSGHPHVSGAAKAAIDRYGTSASASRPVSGERPVQRELEQSLAAVHGVDDCVVFVSGHATNVTVLGHVFGAKDLIVHDSLIHNSITQGALLSGAHRVSFPHNDTQALDSLLTRMRHQFERVLVVLEGIYSMDGDVPQLDKVVEIKRRHRALLMVDEAHSLGVLGERGSGIAEHFGIDGRAIDIWMGTLSKTLGSCGGYIAGDQSLVDYLKASAPGFMYSVGMAPPVAAAAKAALEVIEAEPERSRTLRDRGAYFLAQAKAAGLDTGFSQGFSVIPLVVGSSSVAARLSNALFERGINVQPIIHPAVEERAARLRFFVSCLHTERQIDTTIQAVVELLEEITGPKPAA